MTDTLRKPLELEKVREYLEQGGDPNAMIDGQTLLHEACYWDDLEIVKLLVEYGANVTSEPDLDRYDNKVGYLTLACGCGHAEVARVLLEAGANMGLYCGEKPSGVAWLNGNRILSRCMKEIEGGMDIATAFDEYDQAVAEDTFCRVCSLSPKQKQIYDQLIEKRSRG